MTPRPLHAAAAVLQPWLPAGVVIEDVQPEIPGVATYSLRFADAKHGEQYSFRPGQFNMLYLPGWGEIAISLSGPMRYAASNDEATVPLRHTIREAGAVTCALARLGTGDRLALRGPFGNPWPVDNLQGADIVLIAGGIGLAPLRPVIFELLHHRDRFGRCALLYGARAANELLYAGEYEAWRRAGLEVHTTVDRPTPGWNGNVGVVPLLVDRLRLSNAGDTKCLMCGPEVMMRFAAQSALGRGVAPERIWVSLERHMQCAVGLCGHCQLGTSLLCRDGPVFRWDRVEPLLQIHDL